VHTGAVKAVAVDEESEILATQGQMVLSGSKDRALF
jgi:hypothetical protein